MKRDKRFDGIREDLIKFLKFWLGQGTIVFIVMIPSIFFFDIKPDTSNIFWLGGTIWSAGLIFEAISDDQKYRFAQNPKNKGKWIASGLWKYSRHPNYFGEILCWIGIYIAVYSSLDYWGRIIGLASPLLIIIILVFITGLPPLEKKADKKWGKIKEYKEYKKKTAVLVPFIW